MGKKKQQIADRVRAWVEARDRFSLTHEHVQMARELGLNPRRLGDKVARSKPPVPVPVWIETQFRARYKREHPEDVLPIEEWARRARKRQVEKRDRREQKRAEAVTSAGSDAGEFGFSRKGFGQPDGALLTQLANGEPLDGNAFAQLTGAVQRLVVCGSLNAEEGEGPLAEIQGSWRTGWVHGQLSEASGDGPEVLSWDARGARVEARVLIGESLLESWDRLDQLMTTSTRRIVVPFFADEDSWCFAQAYVPAAGDPG